MSIDIPIKLSEKIQISGSNPIVILGPNGAGKSRHAVTMLGWNNADMIAALRNIALPPNVVMRPIDEARSQLQSHLQRRHSQPWELSSEINDLFSKLMGEDAAAATRFRDGHIANQSPTLETTKLMRLSDAWTRLFPGRHIIFTGYHPRVQSDYNSASGEYSAQQMSDGERVALYLAGRILDSDAKIIIVDEPEVHFHSRLASRFWNELESLRPDCRFVYVTHDLSFSLSRQNAQYVIVMPNKEPQLVQLQENIPKDLAESLLSAASFSIHANRIVFCEGLEGRSRDQLLYSAWFKGSETAVVPVGSGKDVIRCARAFSESKLVAGVESIGIIDRDYWPDRFLESLPNSIFVLPFHEIENLYCLESLFLVVAKYLGKSIGDAHSSYSSSIKSAKAMFQGGLMNKQISERFRRRCDHEFNSAMNALDVTGDLVMLESLHIQGPNPNNWESGPKDLFNEERITLEEAITGGEEDFIRLFPGKTFLNKFPDNLGLEVNSYIDLVCSALLAEESSDLATLGKEISEIFKNHLPERRIIPGE